MNLQCLLTQLLKQYLNFRAVNAHFKGAEIQQIFDKSAMALTGFISDSEKFSGLHKFCSMSAKKPAQPKVSSEPRLDSILMKSD